MPIKIEKVNAKASIVVEKKIEVEVDKKYIKDLRLKLKLTQSAFAEVLGVTKKSVEKWEQGINKINGSARKIVEILNDNPEMVSLFSPNIQKTAILESDSKYIDFISYSSKELIYLEQKILSFIDQDPIFKVSIQPIDLSSVQKEKNCGTKN